MYQEKVSEQVAIVEVALAEVLVEVVVFVGSNSKSWVCGAGLLDHVVDVDKRAVQGERQWKP